MGHGYSIRSDVWSLGITILEIALGYYPYLPGHPQLSVFELLDCIINQPAPRLSDEDDWSPLIHDFLRLSLVKDYAQRPTSQEMLSHPFIVRWPESDTDIAKWVRGVCP